MRPEDLIMTRHIRDRLLAVSNAECELDMAITVVSPDFLPTPQISPGCYLVAEDACGSAIYLIDDDHALVRLELA